MPVKAQETCFFCTRTTMLRVVTFAAVVGCSNGFVTPNAVRAGSNPALERHTVRMSAEGPSDRAQFLTTSAAVAASAVMLPLAAVADEEARAQSGSTQVKLVTTKLGGKLEPFADVSKGYRLAKPLGWNRYDGTSGEYTVKMVDLVDPTTLILLTNSPVKSDTELSTLGSATQVGEKLSKGRDMELVSARDRVTEGIRLYDFEFKGGGRRELKTLSVNKNKLWNLTLGCPEKAWEKQEEPFKTIVDSFLPRL
ncbi:unnamed protein product [Ectocarpus fasciculatus]